MRVRGVLDLDLWRSARWRISLEECEIEFIGGELDLDLALDLPHYPQLLLLVFTLACSGL
jgi:hypothetical protein